MKTVTAIPAQVLRDHVAILGKTGSGKTSTAKRAVEQIVSEGGRVCILDLIKSDWWGLTSSADGKRAGLPFRILGGPRGHVPLHSSAGAAIGEIVATGALPLSIIDMADFEPGGLQRFFVDFAPALLKRMRGVVHLVIEEAHELAPKERAGIGAENMAIHWAKKLATAGRSKGVRMILATQRTQSLHNALLGSCETMIVHRLTAPADQEPVKKWLQANTIKDVRQRVESSLASLKTGSGWLCSGEAGIFDLVQFPRITTYDNTATPTSTTGEHRVVTAPVDQDQLRAIIGDAVKQAEENDPKKLKAEIAKLQRELQARQPATAEPPAIDQNAIALAEEHGFERAKKELSAAAAHEAHKTITETLIAAGERFDAFLTQQRELGADVGHAIKDIFEASKKAHLDVAAQVIYRPLNSAAVAMTVAAKVVGHARQTFPVDELYESALSAAHERSDHLSRKRPSSRGGLALHVRRA